MAKFRLNSASVLTLDSNAVPCPVSVDLAVSTETFKSMCAGQTVKETVYGLQEVTMTVNGELEADSADFSSNFAIGAAGALVFQPNGTTAGDMDITSTNATVTAFNISSGAGALTSYSMTLNLDDLTVGVNS
jgi:hypothetical protein